MLKIQNMIVSVICICPLITGCAEKSKPRPTADYEMPQTVAYPAFRQNSTIVRQTNTDEKKVLIRLVRYLQDIDALISEAEIQAQADSRIRFDYQQLRFDLSAISHGIRTHIHLPNQSPRAIDAIPGQYGR